MADLPLTSEELRPRLPEEATDDVPDELRALDEKSLPAREVRRIERAAPETYQDEAPLVLEGQRPAWVPQSYPPRSTARPQPPTVKHHGHTLEPMFISGSPMIAGRIATRATRGDACARSLPQPAGKGRGS